MENYFVTKPPYRAMEEEGLQEGITKKNVFKNVPIQVIFSCSKTIVYLRGMDYIHWHRGVRGGFTPSAVLIFF